MLLAVLLRSRVVDGDATTDPFVVVVVVVVPPPPPPR